MNIRNIPRVSFILPALNAEKYLNKCLKSIRFQSYPKKKVEIIIADGGSKDKTIEIAKKYKCILIKNKKIRAEFGHNLAAKISTGSILIYIAADNYLPNSEWIKLIVQPFIERPKICGVVTQIDENKKDKLINRYYSKLHVEPFSWFIYRDACNPKFFYKIFKPLEILSNYTIYKFPLNRFPLIAWAQGFAVRKNFKKYSKNSGDDILPFIQMVKNKKLVAYVPKAGIYHDHLESFLQYIKKYKKRIKDSFKDSNLGYLSREQFFTKTRRMRKYLWIIYSLSIFMPLYHSLIWSVRDKNICWLWHLPCCFFLTLIIIYEFLVTKFIKREYI